MHLRYELSWGGALLAVLFLCLGFPLPAAAAEDLNTATVTVLLYMNGSTLESDYGEASDDLTEILNANPSDSVNVLVETLGTKNWQGYNISPDNAERYVVKDGTLELADGDLGQLDCTEPETLTDFIRWGTDYAPADRYILLLWDHGSGPVYGFGWNEWGKASDALHLDELQTALADSEIHFDLIGMDCCVMSTLETAYALRDFADYTVLSEGFESDIGWYYTDWLNALAVNPKLTAKRLGRTMIRSTEDESLRENREPDHNIMTLIEESKTSRLMRRWIEFAYENEDSLFGEVAAEQADRVQTLYKSGWITLNADGSFNIPLAPLEDTLRDYYLIDVASVAENVDSENAVSFKDAFANAVIYRSYSPEKGLTGLSTTIPYGNVKFYTRLKNIYLNCGMEEDYISWLGTYADADLTQFLR